MNEITCTPDIKLNLIVSMKTWLSNIISLIGFRNYGEEYQQGIVRLIIVSSAILFVCLTNENITHRY